MDITISGYDVVEIEPYIELINTAFADHPIPLRVTREQIEHIHANPDFDPAAIAILRNDSGAMIGFCTTGVDRSIDPPAGSIRLVGVLREYRGRGLGRWLLIWGIELSPLDRSLGYRAFGRCGKRERGRALPIGGIRACRGMAAVGAERSPEFGVLRRLGGLLQGVRRSRAPSVKLPYRAMARSRSAAAAMVASVLAKQKRASKRRSRGLLIEGGRRQGDDAGGLNEPFAEGDIGFESAI